MLSGLLLLKNNTGRSALFVKNFRFARIFVQRTRNLGACVLLFSDVGLAKAKTWAGSVLLT